MSKFPVKSENKKMEEQAAIGNTPNNHGIHWIVAAILIVGETAGGGLVALPNSMVKTGIWSLAALIIICAIASAYTAILLGENWIMMQDRWPAYRHCCRNPYPEMAFRALGSWARTAMSIVLAVQQVCLCIVLILLASNNTASLLFTLFSIKLNLCFVALIVTAILLPFLMLESPKDFWQIGLIALISTSSAIVLIFIGAAHDHEHCIKEATYPPVVIEKFSLTYVMLIMYLPISIYGYLVYGDSLDASIIPSLQLGWVQIAVNMLITVHVIVTIIILISPVNLSLEEIFKIENKFGVGRVVTRTSIIIGVLFTVPKFGPIVDLIGGSTVSLISMILPGIFWLSLVAGEKKRDVMRRTGKSSNLEEDYQMPTLLEAFNLNNSWTLLLNGIVIAFGVLGGIAATVSAVNELVSASWEAPCYVQLVMGTLAFSGDGGIVNCCGQFNNVTTVNAPDFFCAVPKF